MNGWTNVADFSCSNYGMHGMFCDSRYLHGMALVEGLLTLDSVINDSKPRSEVNHSLVAQLMLDFILNVFRVAFSMDLLISDCP